MPVQRLDRQTAELQLRNLLKQQASLLDGYTTKEYRWSNPQSMLMEIGQVMGGGGSIDTELVELVACTDYHEVKQCYKNCMMLSQYADWNYCEGYVLRHSLPFPVLHAWLELDGFVYDPTLRELGTIEEEDLGVRLENNNQHQFYYGIKIDKDVMYADLMKRMESYSVLQDYEHDYPVLMKGSPWLI